MWENNESDNWGGGGMIWASLKVTRSVKNEPPLLSESLAFPEPPPLSESLASSMPAARSIFVPKTPSHPALICRSQSLNQQSFRTFMPWTASFLTLQVANDAHIIAPPSQFSDALFSHILDDNWKYSTFFINLLFCNTYTRYSHVSTYARIYMNLKWLFINIILHNYLQCTENNERTFFTKPLFNEIWSIRTSFKRNLFSTYTT